MRELRRAAQAEEKRIEAQQIGHARLVHGLPDAAQLGARRPPVAAEQTGRERDGVDGAGTRRADPADLELLVLEQPIEHAPGEGAVRAAALKSKIDPSLSSKQPHAFSRSAARSVGLN